MKRQYIVLVLLIILLPIFFFLILPTFDIPQFFESLKNTNVFLFVLAILAVLISNSFAALRWSLLMKEVNAEHSSYFLNAFGIFSIGQIAGLIVPSRVGNYTKVPLVMKIDDLSFDSGLSAVNAETVLDLTYICVAGIVSLLILSTLFLSLHLLSLVLLVFLIALLFVILIILYKIDHFTGFYEKLLVFTQEPSRHLLLILPAQCLVKLFELSRSTRSIFKNKKTNVKLGFFSLCFHLIGVLGFILVINSAHTNLPVLIVFAMLTISYLVGIISLIPGGLGASDLSLIVLLVSEDISLPVATNIALLWRIVMYLPILLVIGVYFIQKNIESRNKIKRIL